MHENKETFHYNYSAQQQGEIRRIREKYLPKEESALERLYRLDASVTKPGTIAAIAMGCIGTLLLGIGMSCTMVWAENLFLPGILIGLLGIAGIAAAYPLYQVITKKRRKKLAPEILRLSEELTE
ncbi:MAG: hypothetical protein Q4C48_07505 [Lachnospiraceae bacterium]|nr:hypothetical protein [Lachnospiraceae bacterium]